MSTVMRIDIALGEKKDASDFGRVFREARTSSRTHTMQERVYKFDKQGHTLGCLIKDRLFENGAQFAACVVPHPQDDYLNVHVMATDPDDVLIRALQSARSDLVALRDAIDAACSVDPSIAQPRPTR